MNEILFSGRKMIRRTETMNKLTLEYLYFCIAEQKDLLGFSKLFKM